MDIESENQLLKRLQDEHQSREAFNVLVNEFSESLYWQIRKMVLNHVSEILPYRCLFF